MIITLKGANFSTSNIGTLSTYSIRFVGSGVTNSNTSVDRESNTGYTTTIALGTGYELNGSITVTMGGTDITSTAVSGSKITISKVTGNVVITVPTKNTAGGEDVGGNEGGNSGDSGSTTSLVINIEAGTLTAPDGKEDSSTSSRWRSADFIETSKIKNTISVTGSRYIIVCYDSSKAYLGQVSNTNQSASYIKGSGQWQTSGTVINKSSITADTAYIRFVFDASNVQILIDGTDCFGKLVSGGSSGGSTAGQGVATIYPFETGSLAKETGAEIASSTRWRMSEAWTLDKFGSKFTVQECGYAVCCFDASDNYLGQYKVATNQITGGDVITAAIWNAAASETLVANLTTLGVAKVRILAENATVSAHLYVDGNIVTA